MKLRNKKTGEIVTADLIYTNADNFVTSNYSLAELNEEWEDWKESKEHWYIDWDGKLMVSTDEEGWERAIAIGNYFSTKEEAQKAVEKLKAWKRLKDKGFEFRWIDKEVGTIKYAFFLKYPNMEVDRFDYEDLDLLFGGEE